MERSELNSDFSAMLKATGVARVRCPKCLKLFAIHAEEIKENRPKFKCSSCEQKFWIAFPEVFDNPDATIGFPMEWIETPLTKAPTGTGNAPTSTNTVTTPTVNTATTANAITTSEATKVYNCPKCANPFKAQDKECSKCGVVFEKHYRSMAEKNRLSQRLEVSKDLKYAWDDVIETYDNFDVHQRFLNTCFAEQNLDFASANYADILSACPSDELALKALKQIDAFTTVRFESLKPKAPDAVPLWKKINLSKFKASYVLLLVAVGLIVVGLASPMMRNLVGFGSSILFVLLALRFYFRAI